MRQEKIEEAMLNWLFPEEEKEATLSNMLRDCIKLFPSQNPELVISNKLQTDDYLEQKQSDKLCSR